MERIRLRVGDRRAIVITKDARICIQEAEAILGAPFTFTGWYSTIGNVIDGRMAAVVIYTQNGEDIELHLVMHPGSRWLTSDFARAIFSFPFRQLGLNRVSAVVVKSNYALQRLLIALGFVIEGIRRKFLHGEDVVLFGMLKEECRYGQ